MTSSHKLSHMSIVFSTRNILTATTILLLSLFLSNHSPQLFHPLTNLDSSLIGLLPGLTPRKTWGYTFNQLQTINLRGQIALITGANSGIGYEISQALSRQGAHVIMGCRSPQRCFRAADKLRSDEYYSGAMVTPLVMDVSNLNKVRQSALLLLREHDQLDMLFLNAGIFVDEENELSVDGIEKTFATNVVGHHLLYRLVEPLLLNSTMARVVSTSSLAGLRWLPPSSDTSDTIPKSVQELNEWKPPLVFGWSPDFVQPIFKYGRSKLGQVAWSKALTRRLGENSTIYVNAAHPGAVSTPMTKDKLIQLPWIVPEFINKWRATIIDNLLWTPAEGALTELYLGVATEEMEREQVRGRYYHPQSIEVDHPYAERVELQENVWQLCETIVEKFL